MAWLIGKILAVYTTGAPGNSWAYMDGGIGWRRLSTFSEPAEQRMLTVCTDARSNGNTVYLLEPAPGVPILGVYSFG